MSHEKRLIPIWGFILHLSYLEEIFLRNSFHDERMASKIESYFMV